MSGNNPYTHFRGDSITRGEFVERTVVEKILESCSKIPDEKRVWGKVFELKHSSSVAQIGRLLAQKRGLNPEIGMIICALHDIYVNETGDAKDHAAKGAVITRNMLVAMSKFTPEEIELISTAVGEHSNKHLTSTNPYVELVKDADVFDCSLYVGAHDAYVYEKPPEICRTYFDRVKRVRVELGLPYDPQWDILDFVTK